MTQNPLMKQMFQLMQGQSERIDELLNTQAEMKVIN